MVSPSSASLIATIKLSYDLPLLAFVIDQGAPSAKAGDATPIVTSATANSAATAREAVFKNDFMLKLLCL